MRIPLSFQFGQVPSSSFLIRMFRKDPIRKIEKIFLNCLSLEEFNDEIKRHTQETLRLGITAHTLIYIHGYNMSFSDAAVRAAQLAYDLKVPGPTVFFSWPSRHSVAAYSVDEASIETSERAIADFLVDCTAHCGAEKVHVIAHSMGRGLLRALQ